MHERRILIVCQLSRYTKLLVNDRDITVVIHSIRADLTPALGMTSLISFMTSLLNRVSTLERCCLYGGGTSFERRNARRLRRLDPSEDQLEAGQYGSEDHWSHFRGPGTLSQRRVSQLCDQLPCRTCGGGASRQAYTTFPTAMARSSPAGSAEVGRNREEGQANVGAYYRCPMQSSRNRPGLAAA
jgi:hypothetical protein